MSVEIKVTAVYLNSLQEIEDFIWKTSDKNISVIERFLDEHERMQIFVKENPYIPALIQALVISHGLLAPVVIVSFSKWWRKELKRLFTFWI